MQTVYTETTIVSYLAARPSKDPLVAGRQLETRAWWEGGARSFELVTSELTLDEANRGDTQVAARRLAFLRDIRVLRGTLEAEHLARILIEGRAIPTGYPEDAAHVAIASVHEVDFLVTWNCRHLANVFFRRRMEDIVRQFGRKPPILCTPTDLEDATNV